MIRVQTEPFDPATELARLTSAAGDCGAIVSFVGRVRGNVGTPSIDALELQHYPGFTEAEIERIAEATRRRFAIEEINIIHRHGRLAPGEPIVFVGAAATHRRDAFEAVDYAMDRLKTEAPFWKKETRPAGSRWVEARAGDLVDRQRWEADSIE